MIYIAITNNLPSLGCRLLTQLIQYCGALPVLIPCFLPMQTNFSKQLLLKKHMVQVQELLAQCHGVIIPGNRFDINPHVYGESIHAETDLCTDPYNVRFETECFMARYAINHDMPFIGICGGMHIMNAILGGRLIQHLPDDDQVSIHHFDDSWELVVRNALPEWEEGYLHHLQLNQPPVLPFTKLHSFQVKPNSTLGKLYKAKNKNINVIGELSLHHQGCFASQLSDFFEPTAFAPDGIVEAAELKGYATMGLITQFHWEYNIGGIAHQLMAELVACCKKRITQQTMQQNALYL